MNAVGSLATEATTMTPTPKPVFLDLGLCSSKLFNGDVVLTGTHLLCTQKFGVRFPASPPINASVAQLVEQWIEDPRVGGSIPSGGTIIDEVGTHSVSTQPFG